MSTIPSPNIALYVWPAQWGLPTFDPLCLAALLYLQHSIPGKFQVVECSDPDASPTGNYWFPLHLSPSLMNTVPSAYRSTSLPRPRAAYDGRLRAHRVICVKPPVFGQLPVPQFEPRPSPLAARKITADSMDLACSVAPG